MVNRKFFIVLKIKTRYITDDNEIRTDASMVYMGVMLEIYRTTAQKILKYMGNV